MFLIHRYHTDSTGAVTYSTFEGTKKNNSLIPSYRQAETRHSEILWQCIKHAQDNFHNYTLQDNAVTVQYSFGTVTIHCTIIETVNVKHNQATPDTD